MQERYFSIEDQRAFLPLIFYQNHTFISKRLDWGVQKKKMECFSKFIYQRLYLSNLDYYYLMLSYEL